MKFSIKDFFSKFDQICSFLRIWSHLLNKSLMENFIFCAVFGEELVKPNFSFFIYFNFRDIIHSYKIETWDWRNGNLWLQLPLFCICWWCNLFLEGCYFSKAYGWHFFLFFSGLKPNLTKSEIEGIGFLKWVQVTVCGMRCIDLNIDTLKIVGTHFFYNEKLKEEN